MLSFRIMMDTIHTKDQLKIALKSSETHARGCAFDTFNCKSRFQEQIEPGYLSISTSPRRVKKAIKVYKIFLTRMLQEGFYISMEHGDYHTPASAIMVDGESFPVRVRETFCITPAKSSFETRTSKPSGKLVLEIYHGFCSKPSKVISATSDAEWAEKANAIIPYLRALVEQWKIQRIEDEPWERQEEEEERKREEKEKIISERAEKALSVLEDIRLFERAELMRKYCDIAMARASSEEYKETLTIARSVADWIDPTLDYEDEILAEKYDAEDFI